MTSKLEPLEEFNSFKSALCLPHTNCPPLNSGAQRSLLSISVPKRERNILAPLKEERGRTTREKETKNHVSFSVPVEAAPVIIRDQAYIRRKKTFEIFLRSRDVEIMIGGKGGSSTIEKNSSIDLVKNMHSKSQKSLKSSLRNKGGKMFTNELWSSGYYMSVINSSRLKQKSNYTSSLMLKPSHLKAQELESLCDTVQGNKQKNSSYHGYDSTQSLREGMQYADSSVMLQTAENSPRSVQNKKGALRSILKNMTPAREGGVRISASVSVSVEATPKNLMGESPSDQAVCDIFDAFKPQKKNKSIQKFHISFEKKYEEEGGSGMMESSSPAIVTKRRMLPAGGFLASISKFSVKNPLGVSSSAKNSRRDKSEDPESIEASDIMRQECDPNSLSRSVHGTGEMAENIQRVQQLINRCRDLGQETKNLEKEILDTTANLEAFTKRRPMGKLHSQKTAELSEIIQMKTKFMKVVYTQKQGIM